MPKQDDAPSTKVVSLTITDEPGTDAVISIDGKEMTLDQALQQLQEQAGRRVVPRFDPSKPRVIEPVEVQFGLKTLHLRLPFWALKRFQKETGVSPWDSDKVFSWPPDMDITVALIWAGLLDENPDITIGEVERLEGMEFANIHYLRMKLDECWGRNPADAPKPSTGTPGPN